MTVLSTAAFLALASSQAFLPTQEPASELRSTSTPFEQVSEGLACPGPFLYDGKVLMLGRFQTEAWAHAGCLHPNELPNEDSDRDATNSGRYFVSVTPNFDDPDSCEHFYPVSLPVDRDAFVFDSVGTWSTSSLDGTYFTYADLKSDQIHGELSMSGTHSAEAHANGQGTPAPGKCTFAGTSWSLSTDTTTLPGANPNVPFTPRVQIDFRLTEHTLVRIDAEIGASDTATSQLGGLSHVSFTGSGSVTLTKILLGKEYGIYRSEFDLTDFGQHIEDPETLLLSPGDYVFNVQWEASSAVNVAASAQLNQVDDDSHSSVFHHYCSGTITEEPIFAPIVTGSDRESQLAPSGPFRALE